MQPGQNPLNPLGFEESCSESKAKEGAEGEKNKPYIFQNKLVLEDSLIFRKKKTSQNSHTAVPEHSAP